MKLSYKNIRHITSITLCLLSSPYTAAQQAPPDAYYRKQEKIIDSLTSRKLRNSVDAVTTQKNINNAAAMYLDLSKKYVIMDPIGFFYYSVGAQNPEGFYLSCKELIRLTADSVEIIIKNYANTWGRNDISVLKKEPLTSAIKRIKKEEGKLVEHARIHIDWKWNIDLKAIYLSNIEFRSIPVEYFKDTASWTAAMIQFDSTHLSEICRLVEENGFPYYNNVGLNSGYIRIPLKHAASLVYFKDDPKRADYFIEKWKFLMPFLFHAVNTGQLDEGFYKHLTRDWIMEYLAKGNRKEDLAFFKKFELKD